MSNTNKTRDAMIQKAEARLEQIEAEASRLKAKADEADADMQLKVQKELAEVETKRDDFKAKLAAARDAGEDALEDMANGFEQAWTSLSEALDRARSRFS